MACHHRQDGIQTVHDILMIKTNGIYHGYQMHKSIMMTPCHAPLKGIIWNIG